MHIKYEIFEDRNEGDFCNICTPRDGEGSS